MPGSVFTVGAHYPYLEAWVTGDKRDHNLLDRPRNAPTRTQRRHRDHGRILRLPHGEFIEVHEPLTPKERAVLESAIESYRAPLPAPDKVDANGVKNKRYAIDVVRYKLSRWFYADDIVPPTRAEIEAGQAHVSHDAALEAPLHEYDEAETVMVPFHGGILHTEGEPATNREQLEERGGNL